MDIWKDFNTHTIDFDKYFKHFTFAAVTRKRVNGVMSVYSSKMKACTTQDFTSRGVELDEMQVSMIEKNLFLCFDMDSPSSPFYKVENFYNDKDRTSFQINVLLCHEDLRRDCKNES